MSIWKRFKNWLIKKLGGYTEEQTKIIEKVVEKPLDVVEFTYHKAEPIVIQSRIVLNQNYINMWLADDPTYIDRLEMQLKEQIASRIGKELVENHCLNYKTTYDRHSNSTILNIDTQIYLSNIANKSLGKVLRETNEV